MSNFEFLSLSFQSLPEGALILSHEENQSETVLSHDPDDQSERTVLTIVVQDESEAQGEGQDAPIRWEVEAPEGLLIKL